MRDYLFTSESVSEGHPDKVADQISDTVLDYLTSNRSLDGITDRVRNTIREIGYVGSEMGFDHRSCSVMVALDRQSQDIAQVTSSS